jgi:capsule polysaccharide export protein KpsE/RkpR
VVSALDEDPAMARQLAEFVIEQADRLIGRLQRQKLKEVMEMHALSLQQIKVQVDSVDSALNRYRSSYGILDYESQVKEITRQYYKSLGSGSVAQQELRKALENLTRHGAAVQFLSARAKGLGMTYGRQEDEYFKSLRDHERSFSYTNILTRPKLSDKRAFPVRWVFTLAGFAASLFFGILAVAFMDRSRKDNAHG